MESLLLFYFFWCSVSKLLYWTNDSHTTSQLRYFGDLAKSLWQLLNIDVDMIFVVHLALTGYTMIRPQVYIPGSPGSTMTRQQMSYLLTGYHLAPTGSTIIRPQHADHVWRRVLSLSHTLAHAQIILPVWFIAHAKLRPMFFFFCCCSKYNFAL